MTEKIYHSSDSSHGTYNLGHVCCDTVCQVDFFAQKTVLTIVVVLGITFTPIVHRKGGGNLTVFFGVKRRGLMLFSERTNTSSTIPLSTFYLPILNRGKALQ